MQRITRLPLLVDAVLSKLKTDDDEFESWKMTLAILNKVKLLNIDINTMIRESYRFLIPSWYISKHAT